MQIIAIIFSIVSLACWIITLIAAFKKGTVVMGVVSICPLVAFILGWVKSSEWDHRNVMIVWTIAVVIGTIVNAITAASTAAAG